LHWIAENSDEPRESGALYGLANGIEDHLKIAERMRGGDFRLHARVSYGGGGVMAQPKEDPIFAKIRIWKRASDQHEQEFDKNGWKGDAAETCKAYHTTAMKMARTVPKTMAGAYFLLNHALESMKNGDAEWHIPAVESVTKFLKG
jgi:hypothetical protein